MEYAIKDVTNIANVSITTVSRVSNGSKGVSAKTRRRVLSNKRIRLFPFCYGKWFKD